MPLAHAPAGPDLLSDLFESLQLRTSVIASFGLAAPWGLEVPFFGPALFYAVLEGQLWLTLDGASSEAFGPGDVFLLPGGTSHKIGSAPEAAHPLVTDFFAAHGRTPWRPGGRLQAPILFDLDGPGPVTRFLTLLLDFSDAGPNSLRRNLPELVQLSAEENRITPWLRPAVESILEGQGGMGYVALATRLAELLFINTIRNHLLLRPEAATGWLRGMSHAGISRALAAMHREPGRARTVAMLAREAGMSRSAFAQAFSQLMGEAPFGYLTGLRMRLAAERIAGGHSSVKAAARDFGYASEKAFSQAFRRTLGRPPGTLKPTYR